MSSEIIFRDAAAPTDPDSNLLLRWENTISTPIIGATYLDDGEAISDVYTVAATSATTVNVTADDPKNEVVGTGIAVTADDSTVNYGVVPGVGIVFSSSLANGWTGKFSIGALMASGGTTSDRLNIGIVLSDDMSAQRRCTANNVGSEDSAESKIYSLPGFFVEDDAQPWIKTIRNHTDVARQASAVPADIVITYGDYQSGSPDTADIYTNVDGGGAVKTIEDAKLDGSELYQYGSGNGYIDGVDGFLGLGIVFNANGDPSAESHNLHVRAGFAWIEFAPDSSGSPGTWQSGPLDLTELGETTGTITAGGFAYYWIRAVVPSSASPGTRKLFNLLGIGLTV